MSALSGRVRLATISGAGADGARRAVELLAATRCCFAVAGRCIAGWAGACGVRVGPGVVDVRAA